MVALDVMGGDNAPREIIQGAFCAANQGVPVLLCGDETIIRRELGKLSATWQTLPLTLMHCSQSISMSDDPVSSVSQKKDSSLVRAVGAVVDGMAQAVVSAGNSGAALVAGTLFLKRAKGVLRPAIGGYIPTKGGKLFCLDLGANADCKPEYLEQFALMGHVFLRLTTKITDPRIGLLANGAEPYKGSQLIKKSYERLQKLPISFVGSVEARDIFQDTVDVLVSDGFSGNIMIKTAQGTGQTVIFWLKSALQSRLLGRLVYRLWGRKLLEQMYSKVDHTQKSGALLLGLEHPFIVVHGACEARAIELSLLKAHKLVKQQFVPKFNSQLREMIKQSASFSSVMPQKIQSLFTFFDKGK